jgi:2-polyprenyl-3-methyl-5-hydroxy-6-metoxy-1,4-benzoquinol methylase
MKKAIRRFISWQVRCSKWIDRTFFGRMSIDGNTYFVSAIRNLVVGGGTMADIGGGKTPAFGPEEARERRLQVTGVDIDPAELSAAPDGSYTRTVTCAIEEAEGPGDCDFVIAQSVMEHVNDGRLAAKGMASFAKPGGAVATFCPNRRAWFARLNLLLPEGVKRRLLFAIFPEKRERQGFPAHYSGCTPSEMLENMRDAGVHCIEIKYFYVSSYFMFFVPLYLFWRIITFPFMVLWPHRYCETFMYVGRKAVGERVA